MRIKKLNNEQDFKDLKKGDFIIVEWSDFFVKHHENACKIMCYNVVENKLRADEVICRIKGNHYFNWKMHLGLDTPGINTSQALEVCKLSIGETVIFRDTSDSIEQSLKEMLKSEDEDFAELERKAALWDENERKLERIWREISYAKDIGDIRPRTWHNLIHEIAEIIKPDYSEEELLKAWVKEANDD